MLPVPTPQTTATKTWSSTHTAIRPRTRARRSSAPSFDPGRVEGAHLTSWLRSRRAPVGRDSATRVDRVEVGVVACTSDDVSLVGLADFLCDVDRGFVPWRDERDQSRQS